MLHIFIYNVRNTTDVEQKILNFKLKQLFHQMPLHQMSRVMNSH